MGRHPDSYKRRQVRRGLVARPGSTQKTIAGESASSKRERFSPMMKRLFWRSAAGSGGGEYSNRRTVGGIYNAN